MKSWWSTVYQHFEPPVIVEEDGKKLYKFVCKMYVNKLFRYDLVTHESFSHPGTSCSRECFEDSTGNLNDHVKICCPQAPLGQGTIAAFASGHLYSAACFRFLLAIWCAQCHQPYKIVFDPELVQIFKMLYAKVDIPLPSTISRDIQEMYTLTKAQVAESLQV